MDRIAAGSRLTGGWGVAALLAALDKATLPRPGTSPEGAGAAGTEVRP